MPSSSLAGNRKNTIAAPSSTAAMAAVYAHWSPARNADFAAEMISLACRGYCRATTSAPEKDFSSWFCTPLVTCCRSGALAIAFAIAPA